MTITLTREEAQQVLDVFLKTREELRACQAVIHLSGDFDPAYVRGAKNAMALADAEIETLRARLAHPEPSVSVEPVAWIKVDEGGDVRSMQWKLDLPPGEHDLYFAPPQREWQGLTDEELEAEFMANSCCDDFVVFEHVAITIKAKLKEKNT